jgi:hypothetical protein
MNLLTHSFLPEFAVGRTAWVVYFISDDRGVDVLWNVDDVVAIDMDDRMDVWNHTGNVTISDDHLWRTNHRFAFTLAFVGHE